MDKIDGPYYFFPVLKRMRDTPAGAGCRWSASTSATPTWCRSTTSPRRWTTSRTSPTSTARPSTWSTPSRSPPSSWSTPSPAAAKAPQFAVPDRPAASPVRLPTALLPRAAAPGEPDRRGAAASAPVHVALDQTIGRLGIPPEVLEHAVVPVGLRLARAPRRRSPAPASAVPDLESYASHAVVATGRRCSTTPSGATPTTVEALTGKTVVITGASSGIGLVTARPGRQGRRRPDPGRPRARTSSRRPRPLIESQGGTAYVYPCDLSDLHAIDALTKQLVRGLRPHRLRGQQRRPLDPALAEAVSEDRFHDFERTMQLNYFGAIRLVMGLLPKMREQKSRPRREHLLDRRADQPAAVLGVRRLQGRPRRLEQRRLVASWSATASPSPASTCRWCGRR